MFLSRFSLLPLLSEKDCLSIPTEASITSSPSSSVAEKSPGAAAMSASLLGSTTPTLAVISPSYTFPSAVTKALSGISTAAKAGLVGALKGIFFFCAAANFIGGGLFWSTMV